MLRDDSLKGSSPRGLGVVERRKGTRPVVVVVVMVEVVDTVPVNRYGVRPAVVMVVVVEVEGGDSLVLDRR